MKRLLPAALLALSILATACSDDDPVTPESFAVVVKVVDTAGDPVPGLLLNLTSDNEYMQASLGKAATRIRFSVLEAVHALVTIEDVEGDQVRTLVAGEVAAGFHDVMWNGRDDFDVHVHGGYYVARLVASEPETGEILWEDTTPMLMALLEPDVHPVGVTDDQGKIVLTDRRLFPHLFDVPPFDATDETGQTIGSIELDAEMIFAFGDTTSGTRMYLVREITGPERMELLWAPWSAPLRTVDRPAPAAGDIIPADAQWGIGPVYPNPFN